MLVAVTGIRVNLLHLSENYGFLRTVVDTGEGDALQTFRYMLVYLHLLVHVEVGQPVIHHYHRSDVVERAPRLAGHLVPDFCRIAFAVAVGQHCEPVSGLQPCFPDEFTHHIGRHVPVDRIYYAYLVRLQLIPSRLYQLGYTEELPRFPGQLPGHIKGIARGGEIKDDASGSDKITVSPGPCPYTDY